jgi:hypothetical protein
LVIDANRRDFRKATPAMNVSMPMPPGLSPVGDKKIVAQFDGGLLSSDGGVLVLREVEQRLRVADRMAVCIADPRAPDQITHTLADIIRFRLLMIPVRGRRRRQFSSDRSCVQNGARPRALGARTVFAVDDLAVGKHA